MHLQKKKKNPNSTSLFVTVVTNQDKFNCITLSTLDIISIKYQFQFQYKRLGVRTYVNCTSLSWVNKRTKMKVFIALVLLASFKGKYRLLRFMTAHDHQIYFKSTLNFCSVFVNTFNNESESKNYRWPSDKYYRSPISGVYILPTRKRKYS